MSFSFRLFEPSAAVAPFVEAIWMVSGHASFDRESVLPNGVVELMVNFGPDQKVHAYGDRTVDEDFRRYWLAGMQERPLLIGSPAGVDHLGIRFRAGGAHAFFPVPMHDVANRVVDLDLLAGRAAAEELRDRLAAAGSDAARAREAERWLLERRYAVHPYYATVRRALDMVHGARFGLRVGEVCDQLGLSNRHLIEQFRRVVGLTPKTMTRIGRFQAVIDAVRTDAEPDWPALAYRFGFADQSHLIREFRHFAGVTPTAFVARRTPDTSHVIPD